VIEQPIRERTIRWDDPAAFVAGSRGRTGLEILRTVVEGTAPLAPIGVLMNFRLVEANEGHVVFEGEPGEYHYNPIGIVHGGFALTLLDSALGCAVHSALPADVGYASTDVQVRFVRGMTVATGTVRCEARTVHVGRTTGLAEGRITDANGKLIATGTTACAIFR
jgi:uncharacterized protein (TIGR00369 family)